MVDLLRMRGLIAAGVDPAGPNPADRARSARRSQAATGGPADAGAGTPADEVELGPGAGEPREIPGARIRLRQEAITHLEARAGALARVAGALAAVREGGPGALDALREGVEGVRGLVGPGPDLAGLLARIEPGSAGAVDPGLIQAAEVEIQNALAAARGGDAAERLSLAADLVAADNAAASRTEVERLDRAAELIRRSEAEGQPAGLLEAMRATGISRARVVELLTTGGG